jgi:hypothetical protein
MGFDMGFDLQIREADFNQIELQIFDPESELYQFNPEVIIVFQSAHKLLQKYNKLKPGEYRRNTTPQGEVLCYEIANLIYIPIPSLINFFAYIY